MKQIFSSDAPIAIGPYSQAIKAGDLLFCSGQTPLEPDSMLIEAKDIEGQTQRVIENLRLVLTSASLTLSDVVKTTVFLTDMQLFNRMNIVYTDAFGQHRPARSTVAVRALPLDALVEIECIASYKHETTQ